MKILFIAPRSPLPADTGGKIRTFNLVREVAKSNDVDLVCFSFEEGDKFFKTEFESQNINVHLVPHQNISFFKKVWMVLTCRQPYAVAKYNLKSMARRLEDLLAKNKYDAVHLDHIHMAHYAPLLKGIPVLVDEHNVEYKILERCASVEKFIGKKVLFLKQAHKMKVFEQKMVPQFSACSVVSSDDAELLSDLIEHKSSIDVVPNGVDTGYFNWPIVENQVIEEEEAVVFTGSMDWLPNDDSAVYFCKEILPLIWSVNKNVKFYVVGKSPSSQLKEIARKEQRIVLTGRVDDVRVYVAKSKVFVVPLRIGGGTRLKILEAMSMAKPVVSTSIGAEGIAYSEDENIVLADIPEIFAEKVLYLLKDNPGRVRLGDAGRKLVLEKYDWKIMGKKLNEIYSRIINASKLR